MENLEIINLNKFLNKKLYTKNGDLINFNMVKINSEFDYYNLFSSGKEMYTIEALVSEQSAGHITFSHIPKEFKEKYFPTFFDWIVHQYGNQSSKNDWNNNKDIVTHTVYLNPNLLNLFQSTCNLHLQEKRYHINELNQKISEVNPTIYNKYLSFENYWVNHPSVELVYVYDEKDLKIKDFTDYPFINKSREKIINFRNQNIAQALHEVSCIFLATLSLSLYKSNKMTPDGEKLWEKLTKLPAFETMLENNYSDYSKNQSRQYLKIK